jgi:hypothetical protein
MWEQCQKLNINHRFFLVSHPQTNRQKNLTNKILLNGSKKKIEGAKECT